MANTPKNPINLIPTRGSLSAQVFENENIGLPPTLFFDIEIFLKPFRFEGEVQRTSIRLDFIRFGVDDWKKLPGSRFTFPKNPVDGYIDGSLYLADAHNFADTTLIHFGELKGKLLRASFEIDIDFTAEGPEELGIPHLSFTVDLKLNPKELKAVMEEAKRVIK